MRAEHQVSLENYTTIRIGGMAESVFYPSSIEDITQLYESGKLNHMIGGGSNLLINDSITFESAVCLKELDTSIQQYDDGEFYIGSSVRLQKAIQTINEKGYGGIEYLYTVPGLIGGAIVMNAGRGKKYGNTISDYIIWVDVFDKGEVKRIRKEDCEFSHRKSVFQKMENCVVVGALFRFEKNTVEEFAERRKNRLQLCKEMQDNSEPNFGSVFCECNTRIMLFVRKLSRLHSGDGCRYSSKTTNWLLRGKNGNYQQAMNCIKRVVKLHKLLHKPWRVEAVIWEK